MVFNDRRRLRVLDVFPLRTSEILRAQELLSLLSLLLPTPHLLPLIGASAMIARLEVPAGFAPRRSERSAAALYVLFTRRHWLRLGIFG